MSAADRPPAAKDRVYAFVKERILDGAYPGGELLSEGEVAEALEVSRTPVREAFLLLEAEGLMRLYPKRGALVVPVSPGEVRDLMDTRLLVERDAARRVARDEGRRGRVATELQDLLDRQQAALDGGDVPAFVRTDRDFHHAIVAAAGNAILARLSDSLRDRQRRMVATTVARDPALMRRFLDEHRAICDAIGAGDARAAGRLVEAHLEGARAGLEGAT
ncbi:MAG TPA: GntR family transcriptional regulator [Miltoncostaeaceae bacterium]|nr:GntR family transcriptional regulator [Miltoncostaeaceae bacterium]